MACTLASVMSCFNAAAPGVGPLLWRSRLQIAQLMQCVVAESWDWGWQACWAAAAPSAPPHTSRATPQCLAALRSLASQFRLSSKLRAVRMPDYVYDTVTGQLHDATHPAAVHHPSLGTRAWRWFVASLASPAEVLASSSSSSSSSAAAEAQPPRALALPSFTLQQRSVQWLSRAIEQDATLCDSLPPILVMHMLESCARVLGSMYGGAQPQQRRHLVPAATPGSATKPRAVAKIVHGRASRALIKRARRIVAAATPELGDVDMDGGDSAQGRSVELHARQEALLWLLCGLADSSSVNTRLKRNAVAREVLQPPAPRAATAPSGDLGASGNSDVRPPMGVSTGAAAPAARPKRNSHCIARLAELPLVLGMATMVLPILQAAAALEDDPDQVRALLSVIDALAPPQAVPQSVTSRPLALAAPTAFIALHRKRLAARVFAGSSAINDSCGTALLDASNARARSATKAAGGATDPVLQALVSMCLLASTADGGGKAGVAGRLVEQLCSASMPESIRKQLARATNSAIAEAAIERLPITALLDLVLVRGCQAKQ